MQTTLRALAVAAAVAAAQVDAQAAREDPKCVEVTADPTWAVRADLDADNCTSSCSGCSRGCSGPTRR